METTDAEEIKAVHQVFTATGNWLVDAMNGLIRPVLTLAFFSLYTAVKFAQYYAYTHSYAAELKRDRGTRHRNIHGSQLHASAFGHRHLPHPPPNRLRAPPARLSSFCCRLTPVVDHILEFLLACVRCCCGQSVAGPGSGTGLTVRLSPWPRSCWHQQHHCKTG